MTQEDRQRRRIPEFTSREEEAEFWDTHDIADYWDELQPVEVEFSENLSENLSVQLSSDALDQLRIQAERMGIGPSTLARMWIIEHLEEEDKASRRGS